MTDKPYDAFVASTQTQNQDVSVLIITADDTQDLEFFYPYYRFTEEGFKVDVATPKGGEFKGKNGMGLKNTRAVGDVSASQYDFLYIPGGKAPATLKKDDKVLALVRDFAESGKPIAAICHGPQVLAAADLIQGRTIAAWPEVEDEVVDAGAHYVNEPTVVDGQFITARWPGDLPAHVKATLEVVRRAHSNKSSHMRRAANG